MEKRIAEKREMSLTPLGRECDDQLYGDADDVAFALQGNDTLAGQTGDELKPWGRLLRSTGKNGQKRNGSDAVESAFSRLVLGNNVAAQNGKWRVAA